MNKPVVNQKYLLEKKSGKGGWTFVRISPILNDKKKPFGQVKVKGTIDSFKIQQYHLLPMGAGYLLLFVRIEILKAIKKRAGEYVQVTLYLDTDPLEIPEEMLHCLEDEPKAYKFFNSLIESEKKYYVQWVYSAKREETKVNRLAKTVNRLLNGEKFYGNK